MTLRPKQYVDESDITSTFKDMTSALSGIVAFPTGGQVGATLLAHSINRVTTVATLGDSVRLPAALPGMSLVVTNRGAASMNVFPATGDTINALAANAALAVAVGTTVNFTCAQAGAWDTN